MGVSRMRLSQSESATTVPQMERLQEANAEPCHAATPFLNISRALERTFGDTVRKEILTLPSSLHLWRNGRHVWVINGQARRSG